MNIDQLTQLRDAISAHLDGKPVEALYDNEWHHIERPNFESAVVRGWRPKPEPKTRPWQGPEDVPMPVCWLRSQYYTNVLWLVVGMDKDTISVSQKMDIKWARIQSYEYSTDGRHWQPCEVTES